MVEADQAVEVLLYLVAVTVGTGCDLQVLGVVVEVDLLDDAVGIARWLFGEDAEHHFMNFFNQLKKNNFPNTKIRNYYFFQIGRWDIQLFDNKTIKFPYNNTDDAIKKSITLLDREDFENYNIIDLRVEGKIIVE